MRSPRGMRPLIIAALASPSWLFVFDAMAGSLVTPATTGIVLGLMTLTLSVPLRRRKDAPWIAALFAGIIASLPFAIAMLLMERR